jgi:proteasome lid subunit RPN8/RPN11
MMTKLVLRPEHRRAIARHGEALYPQECRGLLLGRQNGPSKEVVDLVLINDPSSPDARGYRYSISNAEMHRAIEAAGRRGLQIIGTFHSHVDQPARPSIYDREYVEPTFSYVIVGVRQGRAHELAAWMLSADGTAFFQEDIRNN